MVPGVMALSAPTSSSLPQTQPHPLPLVHPLMGVSSRSFSWAGAVALGIIRPRINAPASASTASMPRRPFIDSPSLGVSAAGSPGRRARIVEEREASRQRQNRASDTRSGPLPPLASLARFATMKGYWFVPDRPRPGVACSPHEVRMKVWIGWLLALCVAFIPLQLTAQEKDDDKKPKEEKKDEKKEEKKDDKPKEVDKDSANYFPLKEGAIWSYKSDNKPFSVKVGGKEKVGDEDCIRLEYLDKDKLIASEYVSIKDTGVYRCAFSGTKADKPYCFLKFPIKDGEEWEAKSTLGGQKIEGKYKLTVEKSPLKIGDKTYDKVVKVEADGLKIDNQSVGITYYFAQNVGMEKQTFNVSGVKVYVELDKYDEGKK